MSVRGLQQAFVEYIGRSPAHELHRVRIDHAKRLLVTSATKTEEVAALCGYPNTNSFWVAFRRDTGISPARYRKKFSHLS
jgi:transcriptional regulator GlxA family with amidase domain